MKAAAQHQTIPQGWRRGPSRAPRLSQLIGDGDQHVKTRKNERTQSKNSINMTQTASELDHHKARKQKIKDNFQKNYNIKTRGKLQYAVTTTSTTTTTTTKLNKAKDRPYLQKKGNTRQNMRQKKDDKRQFAEPLSIVLREHGYGTISNGYGLEHGYGTISTSQYKTNYLQNQQTSRDFWRSIAEELTTNLERRSRRDLCLGLDALSKHWKNEQKSDQEGEHHSQEQATTPRETQDEQDEATAFFSANSPFCRKLLVHLTPARLSRSYRMQDTLLLLQSFLRGSCKSFTDSFDGQGQQHRPVLHPVVDILLSDMEGKLEKLRGELQLLQQSYKRLPVVENKRLISVDRADTGARRDAGGKQSQSRSRKGTDNAAALRTDCLQQGQQALEDLDSLIQWLTSSSSTICSDEKTTTRYHGLRIQKLFHQAMETCATSMSYPPLPDKHREGQDQDHHMSLQQTSTCSFYDLQLSQFRLHVRTLYGCTRTVESFDLLQRVEAKNCSTGGDGVPQGGVQLLLQLADQYISSQGTSSTSSSPRAPTGQDEGVRLIKRVSKTWRNLSEVDCLALLCFSIGRLSILELELRRRKAHRERASKKKSRIDMEEEKTEDPGVISADDVPQHDDNVDHELQCGPSDASRGTSTTLQSTTGAIAAPSKAFLKKLLTRIAGRIVVLQENNQQQAHKKNGMSTRAKVGLEDDKNSDLMSVAQLAVVTRTFLEFGLFSVRFVLHLLNILGQTPEWKQVQRECETKVELQPVGKLNEVEVSFTRNDQKEDNYVETKTTSSEETGYMSTSADSQTSLASTKVMTIADYLAMTSKTDRASKSTSTSQEDDPFNTTFIDEKNARGEELHRQRTSRLDQTSLKRCIRTLRGSTRRLLALWNDNYTLSPVEQEQESELQMWEARLNKAMDHIFGNKVA
ncbi:unnamed protein product [Amoebophrya sp. A25]|nr:unnamed protein product [Amoebophrya sp. A25]|eukprot:GSA25T00023045001.1